MTGGGGCTVRSILRQGALNSGFRWDLDHGQGLDATRESSRWITPLLCACIIGSAGHSSQWFVTCRRGRLRQLSMM